MNARSVQGNSPGEIDAALLACLTDGFQPRIAILFVSIKKGRNAFCELLTRQGVDIFRDSYPVMLNRSFINLPVVGWL